MLSVPSDLLEWSPSSGYPTVTLTVTALASINPTVLPALSKSLEEAVQSLATATAVGDLVQLSQVIRGAEASMTVVSAQQVLATATNSQVVAEATKALFEATYNLEDLAMDENLYSYVLNRGANIFFLVMFALIALFNIGMLWKSRYHWFNVAFICGFILEFLGFLGRVLSTTDYTNINYYLLQYAPLTIAPAFLMGGIYFLFAQNVVMHGRQFTILKPMWYSYFFVAADVVCLVVQGVGGGMASSAAKDKTDTQPGTWVMFVGVLAQVIAMTVFIFFWINFLYRLYFRHSEEIDDSFKLKRATPLNFLRLLLNLPSTRPFKLTQLECFYDQKYSGIRKRKLVPYFPLAITLAVLVIYIRCIYRVVELKEGFDGYLITHEVFIMVLDAALVLIAGLIFVPFHPVFVFGYENIFKLSTIRGKEGAEEEKMNHDLESTSTVLDTAPDASTARAGEH